MCPSDDSDRTRFLGVGSGVGLVVANMIGAGVFLSAGFMAQDMGPMTIMLAWLFGALLALCGVRTYGAVASKVARSGGEYRYLSDLIHPFMGYLAGWGSLLLGFSAPVAVAAYAAGAFLNTLLDGPDPRVTGTLLVVSLTAVHALRLNWSRWTQDVLVGIKLTMVAGFIVLGLILGSHQIPTWEAPNDPGHFPVGAFFAHQFWIAFAFSGWNAAIYASGEFRRPRRDVPLAMLIGCSLVAVLYLAVNWIFVANLDAQQASAVFEHETTRITLGHLVAGKLLGPVGGTAMSVLALLAFASSMSAMTLVGPRVYAEMARDGFLPRALAGRAGRPPAGAVALQGAIALFLLWTHSVLQAVQSASVVILVFSGLVAAASVRIIAERRSRGWGLDLAAATLYTVAVVAILIHGFRGSLHLLIWIAVVVALALGGYLTTRSVRR